MDQNKISKQVREAIKHLPEEATNKELLAIVVGVVSAYTAEKEEVPAFLLYAANITLAILRQEAEEQAAADMETKH